MSSSVHRRRSSCDTDIRLDTTRSSPTTTVEVWTTERSSCDTYIWFTTIMSSLTCTVDVWSPEKRDASCAPSAAPVIVRSSSSLSALFR